MISVIIPIYKGEKYIDTLLKRIENASSYISEKIELIFVNDDPDTPIDEELNSDLIDVRVYNTDINRGIHGARVYGYSLSRGEYIHFLDQDDSIEPLFYKKQLSELKQCDAVICGCKERGISYYNDSRRVSDVTKLEYIIEHGNCIKSPGQLIIRSDAIPDIWKECILSQNGADDLFLWLLMIAEKRTFAGNDDTLFEHVMHDNNQSSDFTALCKSEKEMICFLRENHVFDDEVMRQIDGRMDKNVYVRFASMLRKQRIMKWIMSFMSLELKGVLISQIVKEKNVVIYGAGDVGSYLAEQLKKHGNQPIGYIDRKIKGTIDGVPVKTIDDVFDKCDGIIVSLTKDYDIVADELRSYYDVTIYTLEDILSVANRMLGNENEI